MTLTGDDRVVVIGQGYVGLPIALRAVEVGYHVVGFDVDKDRVDRLRRAETFIDDVSDADLAGALHTGRYTPTDDVAELAGFRTGVVCVPTPLRDGSPDLHYVEDAARLLAPHLTRGTCVVVEGMITVSPSCRPWVISVIVSFARPVLTTRCSVLPPSVWTSTTWLRPLRRIARFGTYSVLSFCAVTTFTFAVRPTGTD